MSRTRLVVILLVTALLATGLVGAQTRLLRYPDIHGDRVVFSYAGDLWTASTAGGLATRLTAHPGVEQFAKFSPDGEQIAFVGQYDGDEQVYVIPSTGGVPKQLTYYPAIGPLPPRWGMDNVVYGWTVDGSGVLFRSLRYGSNIGNGRLYTVSTSGGLPVPLPMPSAGAGAFSPDGQKVAYSPLFRDFRTWKRYEGGWAQDLYVFDPQTNRTEQITDDPRSDRDPMWIGDAIYFSSDRDGTLNLYAYDTKTRATEQLTREKKWDVRWPSADRSGRIVFELNGELQVYDTASGRTDSLAIRVPDDGLSMRPSRIAVSGNIEDFELSPKGERALFVARGDIFTAPIEKGATRNLTRSSDAHDKWARWSPDGKRIAYISDATGEEEVWLVNQDGSGEPQRLTRGGAAMRYAPAWSPDGKRLAFSDKSGKLYVLEIENKKLREIADEERGQLGDYVWSPHGGHIAFSMSDPSGYNAIYIWSLADEKLRRVSGEYFNEFNPAWDPEGNYLFYLADREFAPQIGSVEWNYVVDRETYVYALALRTDVENPFPPESDEVTIDDDESADGDDDKKGKDDKKKSKKDGEDGEDGEDEAEDENGEEEPEPIRIDFEGLAQRVARVPVDADNYGALTANEGHLLYFRGAPFYYGRSADAEPTLMIFSMEDRESEELVDGVRGFAVSGDGKKVLVRTSEGFSLYDASPKKGEPKSVSTSGLEVDRVPRQEWEQIFDEVWRRYRDFFYVENMHGYDWDALRDQYRPLLAHVAHRSDLNYVIGEMISELAVGHAYISGGDYEIPDRPRVALPGAVFELDADADRYRIARILEGQNEEDRYRSPLTEIGVDVREGDYVLAIDGAELRGGDNPYRMLQHKAGRPVELTVNDKPTTDGAREVSYRPITDERPLRFLAWVLGNMRKVEEMTDGRVGYVYVPDMGSNGIREFIKWYYGQIRKEALVIDVRGNGGGNVSQMLIERLKRELLGTRFSRNSDDPGTYPAVVFHGPMVCLLDEDSASDGDIFPHMFREAGLGPLIGKRSWGGVVGITNRGTLIDGGTVFVPEFGTNRVDGSWVIEGHGVDPDIEVENDVAAILDGRDPQLERGVQEVLRMIDAQQKVLPDRPRDPVKTK